MSARLIWTLSFEKVKKIHKHPNIVIVSERSYLNHVHFSSQKMMIYVVLNH